MSLRLTVICPTNNIVMANELSCVTGNSMADRESFRNPSWEDSEGNTYAVVSSIVSDDFRDKIQTQLTRPWFDTESVLDMTLAATAQSKISFELDDIANNLTARYTDTAGQAHEFIAEAGLTVIPRDDI